MCTPTSTSTTTSSSSSTSTSSMCARGRCGRGGGHSQLSAGRPLKRRSCARGHRHRTQARERGSKTEIRDSCQRLLSETLVRDSCQRFLSEILVRDSCRIFLDTARAPGGGGPRGPREGSSSRAHLCRVLRTPHGSGAALTMPAMAQSKGGPRRGGAWGGGRGQRVPEAAAGTRAGQRRAAAAAPAFRAKASAFGRDGRRTADVEIRYSTRAGRSAFRTQFGSGGVRAMLLRTVTPSGLGMVTPPGPPHRRFLLPRPARRLGQRPAGHAHQA